MCYFKRINLLIIMLMLVTSNKVYYRFDKQRPSSVFIYQLPIYAWTQDVYFTELVISVNFDAITVLVLQTLHTKLGEKTNKTK